MSFKEMYKLWATNEYFDEETRQELKGIENDEKEIEERFYKDLEFGTGGLRGIIGAGTNRINIYTVRKASQGVAKYVCKAGEEAKKRGIAIAYDSRFKSPEFAMEAAKVFAQNGVKAYLFDALRPTPELSYAVRKLNCYAGVVVTASHNPKQYNGYKVYGEDGAQLSIEGSDIVLAEINSIDDITTISAMDEKEALASGLIEIIGENVDASYLADLKTLQINPGIAKEVPDFKVIYTPLHGSGNVLVRRILKENGFENVIVVKEQELPDCNFSTVKSPNPEERSAFEIAIELAKKEDVDLIIGTDPDCDRVGVVVRTSGTDYQVFTGNQTGLLLSEYILSAMKENGTLPENGFLVKTIVTTELVRKIAAAYGAELVECLTGFKFIGEQIKLRDEQGDQKYLFGFEESYGYLAGTFARDKDGVVASMLITEMAAWYAKKGMSLYDGLQEIFKKYGYSIEDLTSFTLEGKAGIEKIQNAMATLRTDLPKSFGDSKVKAIRDYKTQKRTVFATNEVEEITLPESNVLYFEMEDGSWFCVRPSGTEPKIKIYYGVARATLEESKAALAKLKDDVLSVIKPIL